MEEIFGQKKARANPIRLALKIVSWGALFIVLTVAISGFLVLQNLIKDLPDVTKLKTFIHSEATEVYGEGNRKIGEFTTERRYPVVFETIPKQVIQAFLAAEDSSFYEHKGIDYQSILRAAFSNLARGRYAQGGSTITQQVARALLLATKKKEITRKIREIVLARRMEERLTKNQILGLYLSEIYLGHGAFGIGAAARGYFNKKVEELTLAEAALLAGLPQRPNEWNPFHNPHLAKKRQQYVLKRMVEEKIISIAQSVEAFAQPLRLYELEDFTTREAPYFTEHVRQYLMNKYGAERILSEGFRVYTTLNLDRQKVAERTLIAGIREVDKRLGWRGVQERIEPTRMGEFQEYWHGQVVDQLTNVRMLPAAFDETEKETKRRLGYDLSLFQDPKGPFYGETPVRAGEYYRAVIARTVDFKLPIPSHAIGYIGKTEVNLPVSTMEWVILNEKPIQNVSQILKAGDVVQVRVLKIDRAAGLVQVSLEQEPEIQGALLSFDVANGDVGAMVGGIDFQKSKFNCALQAKRQVGSTFKPVLYSAALDKGFSPSSLVTDAPIVFKFEGGLDADNTGEDWRPGNYSGTFEGEMPLRLALIRSMNIPTVKILNEITVDYVIEYARSLGITSPMPRDLSIGLGSWSSSLDEVMRAYAVFPRLGKPVVLRYIRKVVDRTGKVIEEYPELVADVAVKTALAAGARSLIPRAVLKEGEVISPQTAYVITDMLKGVVREGTGRPAFLPTPMAGKTGTSNDHRDAWFVGYTPQTITGVWIGYEKDKPLALGETGGKAAAPIWARFMEEVVKDYPKTEFPVPEDIVFAYIDRQTGRLAPSTLPTRVRAAFKIGSVPSSTGDNLPRIGEPGVGNRHTTNDPAAPVPGTPNADSPLPPADREEETSDYLRQGFQED